MSKIIKMDFTNEIDEVEKWWVRYFSVLTDIRRNFLRKYKGNYLDGRYHGFGKMTYADGAVYKGKSNKLNEVVGVVELISDILKYQN